MSKVIKLLVILGAATLSTDLHANIDENSLEKSNLKKALFCMNVLENRPDLAPKTRITLLREECFAEDYIQHSPHVPDGREALLALFSKRYENNPNTAISIKRTAAENDLVWIHMHLKHNPEDLGYAIIHIFRLENGKLAEHWGVGQPVPETSKNANTMF